MKSLLFVMFSLASIFSAQAGIVDDGYSAKYLYVGTALSHDYAGPMALDFGNGAVLMQEAYDQIRILSTVRFDGRVVSAIVVALSPLKNIDGAGHPVYGNVHIVVPLPENPEESDLGLLELKNPHPLLSLLQVTRKSSEVLDVSVVSSTGEFDVTMAVKKDL